MNFEEKIGVDQATQLHFAGADVTLRIKNSGVIFNATTDPMWLVIKDNSSLMRQKSPVQLPSLQPGASEPLTVH